VLVAADGVPARRRRGGGHRAHQRRRQSWWLPRPLPDGMDPGCLRRSAHGSGGARRGRGVVCFAGGPGRVDEGAPYYSDRGNPAVSLTAVVTAAPHFAPAASASSIDPFLNRTAI